MKEHISPIGSVRICQIRSGRVRIEDRKMAMHSSRLFCLSSFIFMPTQSTECPDFPVLLFLGLAFCFDLSAAPEYQRYSRSFCRQPRRKRLWACRAGWGLSPRERIVIPERAREVKGPLGGFFCVRSTAKLFLAFFLGLIVLGGLVVVWVVHGLCFARLFAPFFSQAAAPLSIPS